MKIFISAPGRKYCSDVKKHHQKDIDIRLKSSTGMSFENMRARTLYLQASTFILL